MRTLSRYFVARFLGLFVATLFGSLIAIAIVEMLLNFDDLLRASGGTAGALGYLLLRIPSYYLRDLIPVASFAASFLALGLGARWLEITAMKAGGISPLRAVIPILVTALALTALTFAISETWVVRASLGWQSLMAGGAEPLDYRRGSFWYHRGRTIYSVSSADRETRTLHGVMLFERERGGRLVRSIQAERVRVEEDRSWHLESAVIRRFDPERPDAQPDVERIAEKRIELQNPQDAAFLDADAALLPLPRLREYIRLRESEGDPVQRLQSALHARLSDPLSVLLFALLAVPLGLRVERSGSLGQPALFGAAAVAAFFLLRSVGATLAAEGVVPAPAALWTLLAGFTAVGIHGVTRIPS